MSQDNLHERSRSLLGESTASSLYPKASPPNAVDTSAGIDMEMATRHPAPVDAKDEGQSTLRQAEPDLVDWDGPKDPANPQNWSKNERVGHVVVVSIITLIA